MSRRVRQLPVAHLDGDGLRVSASKVCSSAELAGAQVVWAKDDVRRIESISRSINAVAEMPWSLVARASSAILQDGRLAVLLMSSPGGPSMDVLGLPVLAAEVLASDLTAANTLGRVIARRACRGQIEIADGDLAWLDPRLNPDDSCYFRPNH